MGKLPIDVGELNVDQLSVSGHKYYGPKGVVGAVYVSRQRPAALAPLILRGAQQQGLRAGTGPAFLCAGVGAACRIAREELARDREHCEMMRDAF